MAQHTALLPEMQMAQSRLHSILRRNSELLTDITVRACTTSNYVLLGQHYVAAPSLYHININAGTELSYLSAAAKRFHNSLGAVTCQPTRTVCWDMVSDSCRNKQRTQQMEVRKGILL